uniref:BTB domain-containing protein n=1 Tax=Bracon brevicornis TaxID=1563983 RepID=A0A6V7L537_9HYME
MILTFVEGCAKECKNMGGFQVLRCDYKWIICKPDVMDIKGIWYSPPFTVHKCCSHELYFKLVRRSHDLSIVSLRCSPGSTTPPMNISKCHTFHSSIDSIPEDVDDLFAEPFQGIDTSASIKLEMLTPFHTVQKKEIPIVVIRLVFHILIYDGYNSLKYEPTLFQDVQSLFYTGIASDVVIYAGGTIVNAHKSLLAARSTVFATIFENSPDEKKINITDVTPPVLMEMLRFIYTDKVSIVGSMALDLLAAAKKYNIQRLKFLCEKHLYDNVTTQTAGDIFIAANSMNAFRLKGLIIGFINNHRNEFFQSDQYLQLRETNKELLIELYEAV